MSRRSTAPLMTALLTFALVPRALGQDRDGTAALEVFATALEKGSEKEQLAAIALLNNFPSRSLAPKLAALAQNEDATLRARRSALMALQTNDPALNSSTCSRLLRNSKAQWLLRQDAALGHAASFRSNVPGVDAELLREVLSDWSEPNGLRLTCAMSLLSCPEPKASAAFCSLLEDMLWAAPRPSAVHRQLAKCLPLLTDEKHRNRLRPLLKSPLPRVRLMTAEAWLRLGGEATEEVAAQARNGLLQRERAWAARNEAAWEKIRVAGWALSTRKQLMAAIGQARVVCVGEFHHGAGSYLRRFQIELLEAMAKADAPLAVGYEPPVQHAQQSVLDRANELARVTCFASERGTEELSTLRAAAARDVNCAEVLRERLQQSDDERILLLRGQSHLGLGNTLLAKLPKDCLLIYTAPFGCGVPLELALERNCALGFVARSRRHERLFLVNTREASPHFAAEERALLQRAGKRLGGDDLVATSHSLAGPDRAGGRHVGHLLRHRRGRARAAPTAGETTSILPGSSAATRETETQHESDAAADTRLRQESAAAGPRLRGYVRDASSGAPISGATLTPGDPSAGVDPLGQSDAAGYFDVPAPSDPVPHLEIHHAGYIPRRVPNALCDRALEIALDPGRQVTLEFVRRENGALRPVAGATCKVVFGGSSRDKRCFASGTTDTTGRVRLPCRGNRLHYVVHEAGWLKQGDILALEPEQEHVRIVLPSFTDVRVRILDGRTRRPIAAATCKSPYQDDVVRQSDANGYTTLAAEPGHGEAWRIEAPGYQAQYVLIRESDAAVHGKGGAGAKEILLAAEASLFVRLAGFANGATLRVLSTQAHFVHNRFDTGLGPAERPELLVRVPPGEKLVLLARDGSGNVALETVPALARVSQLESSRSRRGRAPRCVSSPSSTLRRPADSCCSTRTRSSRSVGSGSRTKPKCSAACHLRWSEFGPSETANAARSSDGSSSAAESHGSA